MSQQPTVSSTLHILDSSDSTELEELNRFVVLKYDEIDSDLYDRVSYLDLVNRQREKERLRKTEIMGTMRRFREDSDKFSARRLLRNEKNGEISSKTNLSEKNSSNLNIGHGELLENNLAVSKAASLTSLPSGEPKIESVSILPTGISGNDYTSVPKMDPNIRNIWNEAIDITEIRNIEDQTEFRSLRAQLGIDQISADTLLRYFVKAHMDGYDQPALCYPRYRGPSTRTRVPCGLKIIRQTGAMLKKENFPEADEYGKTRFSGIFGYHMLSSSDNRVVLTTNERDALAVFDATNGIPALTLPNGERLDQAVLPYLEDFELIYLWFPQIHEHHAKEYASYLNASRCYIVTKVERPVELIRDNRSKEILHGIQEAVRVRYRGFRSLIDIREDVKNEIVESKSRLTGLAQWKRYDILNKYLRGFRSGELTVLTGGTGYGKTTFLCEYSMDLYTQGIRTLFCSFEMSEEKILKWMIVQFAGPSHLRSLARSRTYHNGMKIPLHRIDHHASVEMWLDRFERIHADLIIMKVDEFRNKTTKEIADAIKEQVIAGAIQHVVIDNLQFLVGLSTLNNDLLNAQEKLNIQDRFVGMLRRIANDFGPHITLVVHPHKANEELELQNIGGSSRIVQEADNVLVIQRRRDEVDRRRFRKFFYILKNRFGGKRVECDQIEMVFQSSTYTHTLVETSTVK